MKTDTGFGVSIEVQRYEDTPDGVTGLVIDNEIENCKGKRMRQNL